MYLNPRIRIGQARQNVPFARHRVHPGCEGATPKGAFASLAACGILRHAGAVGIDPSPEGPKKIDHPPEFRNSVAKLRGKNASAFRFQLRRGTGAGSVLAAISGQFIRRSRRLAARNDFNQRFILARKDQSQVEQQPLTFDAPNDRPRCRR